MRLKLVLYELVSKDTKTKNIFARSFWYLCFFRHGDMQPDC